MADYIATMEELTAVADAIRAKGGTSEQLVFPEGFVSAIDNIQTGGGEPPAMNAWYPADTAFLIEHFPDGPTINQIGFTETFPDTVDVLGGVLNPCTANKAVILTDLLKDYTQGSIFFDCFAFGATGGYQRIITSQWDYAGGRNNVCNVYGPPDGSAFIIENGATTNTGTLAYRSRFFIGWDETHVKALYDKNSIYGDAGSLYGEKDARAIMSSMVIGGRLTASGIANLFNGAIFNLGFVPRLLSDDEAKAIIFR